MKKKKNSSTLLRLLNVIARYRIWIVISFLSAGISAILQLYIPILFGRAIDYIIGPKNVDFTAIGTILIRILILDDSASALDFATDLHLRQAIRSLAGQRTVFIVSQRVSSVRSADKILVLNDGMLAGSGTHEQLLKSCSVYQEIYRSQTPDHANRKEAAA